jgi:hypothetical protein
MSEFDKPQAEAIELYPVVGFGVVRVEMDGSILIRLSVEEAEKLAHTLPFTYPLAKEIREALRTGGPRGPIY